MTTTPNRAAWAERAACQDYDLGDFFADSKLRIEQAKRVCGPCPVRTQCLDLALRSEDASRYGVFGGLSAAERAQLVQDRGETAAPDPKPEPVTRSGRPPAKCGTRSGYQRHHREGTPYCVPCRQANTDAYNRLLRTGTTRATA